MELTQKRLMEVLSYNQHDGTFTWKVSLSNKRIEGEKAGSKTKGGYIYISVDCKRVFAHRLAFLYMTGKFPVNLVDHIDRNRSNNKWSNLRDVTCAENSQNTKRNEHDGSVHGVSFDKFSNKWRAQIWANGKYFSSRFSSKCDAILWRKTKELELHISQ